MDKKTKNANSIDLPRRNVLKVTVLGLFAGIAAPVLSGLSSANAATAIPDSTKPLIVYFSHSGNTKEIANQINIIVGGDIVEIKTVKPYPENYDAVVDQAKLEQKNNNRPQLVTRINNMESCNTVFIGYPNWWATMPMAMFTFLEGYDFSGKTIIPFCTHEGSALGRSVSNIKKLCPRSTIIDGLAIRGRSAKSAQKDVADWLKNLNLHVIRKK